MGGGRLDTRNPTSKLMLTILAGQNFGSAHSARKSRGTKEANYSTCLNSKDTHVAYGNIRKKRTAEAQRAYNLYL
jgi:hypothetical protein